MSSMKDKDVLNLIQRLSRKSAEITEKEEGELSSNSYIVE